MEFFPYEYYVNELYFDCTGRWRANKLQRLKLTDPALSKGAEECALIARKSFVAAEMRSSAYWSPEAMKKTIEAALEGDEALQKDIETNLERTFDKVRTLEEAQKRAWETRLEHARLWGRVLAAVKPVGGPEREKFPLRFGIGDRYGPKFWVRNVSGKPLTDLTVAVRTNASAELPTDAALHVISLERFEPDEWVTLPDRLLSKIWDRKARAYQSGSNVLRCSVWSSEVHFEDVAFDLKALPLRAPDPAAAPGGWCKWGFFPTADFRGRYDATLPWSVVVQTPRQDFLVEGTGGWYDSKTRKGYSVDIGNVVGVNLIYFRLSFAEPRVIEGREVIYAQMAVFQGKLRGDRFEVELVSKGTFDQPGCPTRLWGLWGTIRGDEMELNYGRGKKADGKLMLRYSPKAKEGDRTSPDPAAALADAFKDKSVWVNDEKKMTLTVLERNGDRFRARFQIASTIDREVNGEVKGDKVSWLAKDVRATRGDQGGDNAGTFGKDRDGPKIDFNYRSASGPGGSFTLRLRLEK